MGENVSDAGVDELLTERNITEVKRDRHLCRKAGVAIGIFAAGAAVVAIPIGVKAYKQGYTAEDNCTGFNTQAVSVLEYKSMANLSRMLHERVAGVIPTFWTNGAVSLNDVVEAQKVYRGNNALDAETIGHQNGVTDINEDFSPGVVCLTGFAPTVDKAGGRSLVGGAPESSFWAAVDNSSGSEKADLIGDVAKANSADIGTMHAFPQTGMYPFASQFYNNILASPGLTESAAQSFRQEVADAGLTPIG